MGKLKQVYPSEMGHFPSLFLWDVPDYAKKYFDRYYLLHWDTQYFMEQRSMYSTVLNHQGVDYSIRYFGCSDMDVELSLQVQLSFKRLEGAEMGVVLVRPKATQFSLQLITPTPVKEDRRKK